MIESNSGNNVLHELELQNPEIARAFRGFRRHGEEPPRPPILGRGRLESPAEAFDDRKYYRANAELVDREMPRFRRGDVVAREMPMFRRARANRSSVIAIVLLVVGVSALAIVVGPSLVRFLATHWDVILLPAGGLCVGASIVIPLSRFGTSPLSNVAPPKVDPEDPLQEIKDLAERTVSRLRAAYRYQLWSVLVVGAIFISLIVWSMVMVSQNRIVYASAFGSSSVAMAVLTQWKWQPFDRINQARRLADNADTLATGLRLRMKTISEINDATKRGKAQWDAVKEYLKQS